MTKTLEHRVKFLAASQRVARICRVVAHKNKYLASCSVFEDLTHLRAHGSKAGVEDLATVVLSHVDDDYLLLKKPEVEPVIDKAFHFLFTETTTHPDQVAYWMRGTKIQAESRLHVCKVEKFEPPQLSGILSRMCSALGGNAKRGGIIDAYLVGELLLVRGLKHRMLHVPVRAIPSLSGQSRQVIHNFRVDPDGSFLHWPDLDVHLGWNQFLQIVDPNELMKAKQRTAGFNVRYGAAIRAVREAAGIPQSKIPRFTDRQIRRIEQGLQRATPGAISALAQAHGLAANEYMEKLAKTMA
jgi:hypothetical protein